MSQGAFAQLGIHANNPTEAGFEFITESLKKQGSIRDPNGIRGRRGHQSERTRTGSYTVSGSIEMYPSPEELAALLPWIMGAAAVSTTFALAETVPARYVQIDRVAKVFTYAGVYVNKATFSASEGTQLKLSLDLIGQTETVGNAGSFPSLTLGTTPPFNFEDLVFTCQSSARSTKDMVIVVDNALNVANNNSLTASRITAGDRMVTASIATPYTSSETALYGQALAGAAATVVYSFNNYSISFNFATLQFPDESPNVAGKSEIPLRMNGVARRVTTTQELEIVLDSTP